jgi:hypothetical protein
MIATIPREMLAGAYMLSRPGYLQIGEFDPIYDHSGVVPLPIVYLVAGFVKQLLYI